MAAVEQAGGVEQTARAMDQMNETAHKNKLSSEQIFQVSDRVRDMSSKVREVTEGVRRFVREDSLETPPRPSNRETGFSASPAPRVQAPKKTVASSSTSIDDEAVLKIVSRLSQKQNVSQIRKPSQAPSIQDISADDPSFRKTNGK